LLNLLLAHAAGSYSVYLVEVVRQYFTDGTTSAAHWTIGAPIFAPAAMVWMAITDRSWLVVEVWASYLLPALLIFECLGRRSFMSYPQGYCAACGYDLRATPDRCPECGAAAKLPPIQASDKV
jgi:hypothetical protein